MRGDIAHDAFDRAVFGVDDDALGLGDGGINAAHLAHINEALLVDIIDDHRDFVGMGGQHQARRAALVEHRHRVAVGVAERFVGERFDIIEPDPLAARFVARRAGSVDKPFQNLKDSSRMGAYYRPAPHKQSFRIIRQRRRGGCRSRVRREYFRLEPSQESARRSYDSKPPGTGAGPVFDGVVRKRAAWRGNPSRL